MARRNRKTAAPEAPVVEAPVTVPETAEVVLEHFGPHLPEGWTPPEEAPAPRVLKTVVPVSYQKAYGAKGHCGDWLANTLVPFGRDQDGQMVFEEWEALFSDNGLDLTAKWANSDRTKGGWQGRYRMSGRQQLEKMVLQRGALIWTDGTVQDAPADWLADMATKHPKVKLEWTGE